MAELIRSRAPVRIGIAGGGTDVNPYAEERGGLVFNTTINKYAYCTLKPREDNMMNVSSEYYGRYQISLENGPLPLDGNNNLIKAVTNYFGVKEGFDISIRSDVPAGSGLGGSSSMIVSMIGAMVNWLDEDLSKDEIASLAYHLEREVIGISGGKQDQYAAVFGGFNSIKIEKSGVTVVPAKIPQDVTYELQCRSVMCFTGTTHDSSAVISTQVEAYKNGQNNSALDQSKELAKKIRNAMRHGEIDIVGKLLGEAWEQKKKFSDKVSTGQIDSLYDVALKNGAIGGKVSGAGGGGFMYFICEDDAKSKVSKALQKEGAIISEFGFESEGVVSWRAKSH